jgi:hypothetical protein
MRDRESIAGCEESSCFFESSHFYRVFYKPYWELEDASRRPPNAFEKSLSVTVGGVTGAISVLL